MVQPHQIVVYVVFPRSNQRKAVSWHPDSADLLQNLLLQDGAYQADTFVVWQGDTGYVRKGNERFVYARLKPYMLPDGPANPRMP